MTDRLLDSTLKAQWNAASTRQHGDGQRSSPKYVEYNTEAVIGSVAEVAAEDTTYSNRCLRYDRVQRCFDKARYSQVRNPSLAGGK